MVSEKGSLKDTPAMKLLLTIFEQDLTGILYIKRADILKVLYFSRGKLIWAISNSDVDKLENILAAKSLVPMEAINNVKKQSKISDSIGKLLVEKGLITLEELIECSKQQLRRIISSILKWKEGGFHFINDTPPERLLSLDLDITQFVVDYIVEEVDVSDIWKEIGTLQVEFIKTPHEQKVTRYRLSDIQKELLNSFDGQTKLETILSRHSSGHRESLLKIIYFFLMAELLVKKEFDLSALAAFDEDKRIDEIVSDIDKDKPGEPDNIPEPAEPTEAVEPVEFAGPGELDNIPGPAEPIEFSELAEPAKLSELSELPKPLEPAELSELSKLSKLSGPAETDELVEPVELSELSKPTKPVEPVELPELSEPAEPSIPMESLQSIDAAVPKPEEIAAIMDDSPVLVPEPVESEDETFKSDLEEIESPPPADDEPAAVSFTRRTEAREEKKRLKFFNIILILVFLILVIGGIILLLLPILEKSDQVKNAAEKTGETETRDVIKVEEKIPAKKDTSGPVEIPAKTEARKPTEEPTGEPGGKTGEEKPGIIETGQTPPTTSFIPGKAAEAYFQEGSFFTAGDVWKKELMKTGVQFGILLELDCMKESVMIAYNRLTDKKDFYILNRLVGSKTCFLVMWGKFFTYEQAAEAIKSPSIPSYFWQQKDPPSIVELSKYL